MNTFMIILLIVAIVILHSFIALYIDRIGHIKGNTSTNWGLIPFVNVYLLGEALFNKLVGVLLFIVSIVSVDWHITLLGKTYGFDILPIHYRLTLFIILLIVVIIFLVYAAVIYDRKVKKTNIQYGHDLLFFIKETLWILALVGALYLLLFIVSKYSV